MNRAGVLINAARHKREEAKTHMAKRRRLLPTRSLHNALKA